MQAYTVAVLLVGILVVIFSTSTTSGIAIDCEANPHVRKFCELLVAGSSVVGDRCKLLNVSKLRRSRRLVCLILVPASMVL